MKKKIGYLPELYEDARSKSKKKWLPTRIIRRYTVRKIIKKLVTYHNYTKMHGPKNNKKIIGYLPQLYEDARSEK